MISYQSLLLSTIVLNDRDVTIWVDAILRIAFECIAIYCHIAIRG